MTSAERGNEFRVSDQSLGRLSPAGRLDIVAQHPDDFLVGLLDLAPGAVCSAVKRQREGLRNPPKTAEELLATLEGHGLSEPISRVFGCSSSG